MHMKARVSSSGSSSLALWGSRRAGPLDTGTLAAFLIGCVVHAWRAVHHHAARRSARGDA